MAFRAHLRGKFRSDKHREGDGTPIIKQQLSALDDDDDCSSTDEKSYDLLDEGVPQSARKLSDSSHGSTGSTGGKSSTGKKDLESLPSEATPSAPPLRQPSSMSTTSSVWGDNERAIYELQLQSLQEQLMDITIKNQGLANELNKYKQNKDLITLLKDLDKEKQKNNDLMQHCRDMEERLARVRRQNSSEDSGSIVVGEEAATVDFTDSGGADKPPSRSRWYSLQAWLMDKVYILMADLSEEPDEDAQKVEEEELSVKILKENIKRARNGYQPIGQWIKAVNRLKSWQSPSATLIAFCIYMYASWHGWLVSLLLGLMLWHLSKTYLISVGWDVKFSLLPYEEPHDSSELDKNMGLSDKFQIVLMVAKKVQHLAGDLADSLEKLHNLVMWGKPEITRKLYTTILTMFITSLVLPGQWMLTLCAMMMGYKLFITGNLYAKFPRLKAKYDSSHIMWKSLPTHHQLSRSRVISQRQTYVVVNPDDTVVEGDPLIAPEQKAFCELFSLPPTEFPLPGWEDGKRCTLLNKDKPTNFKNGRIYLTKNFLCFERAKSRRSKSQNIVMPLAEITKIEKAKFSILPGSGMAIEVYLPSAEKPYMFGGIIGRDEVYGNILKEMERGQQQQQELQQQSSGDVKQD